MEKPQVKITQETQDKKEIDSDDVLEVIELRAVSPTSFDPRDYSKSHFPKTMSFDQSNFS